MKEELCKVLKDFSSRLANNESNPDKIKESEQVRLQN